MAQPLDIEYELGTPDGYTVSVHPGWSLYAPASEIDRAKAVRRVPVGAVAVPYTFEAYVRSTTDDFTVVLMFLADPKTNDIRMAAALSPQVDTDEALDRILRVRPREWWINHAYLSLIVWERRDALDEGAFWHPGMTDAEVSDATNDYLVNEVREAAKRRHPSRVRQSMTDEFLSEVADVYRRAWQTTKTPTTAVAEHYGKPYSTAGRWIGEARKRGLLAAPEAFFDDPTDEQPTVTED